MIIAASTLAILVFSVCLLSQEITGAFGIKFGFSLDKLKVIETSETTDGKPLYMIDPPIKVRLLTEYYVMAAPISKRVYSVWGVDRGLEENECLTRLEAILKTLERKYKTRRKEAFSFFDTNYTISKGSVYVHVRCSNELTDYTLYVQYYNRPLMKQAKKEEIHLKSQQIDESGL